MYNVSNDYIQAIKSAVTRTDIEFEIDGVTYNSSNILAGSFGITNQCTETSDIKLGSVYAAELKATLRNINISRNNWRGKVITPYFKLQIDAENDVWESVPLGIFTVSEANWSRSGIEITAYDNMVQFEKPFTLDQSAGFLYDFLVVACNACNIELGMTEEEVKAMPNGLMYFEFDGSSVSTWRDVVYWVSQTLGGFATIDREGKLIIRSYNNIVVDTLSTNERLVGGKFSDYITSYTAISYHDAENNVDRYFSSTEHDDGITMELGTNPFMQVENQGAAACENLLPVLDLMQYVPFQASNITRDPAYDLGDCFTFTLGLAGESSLCCLQMFDFTLHNRYQMKGYGADPSRSAAKSRMDKSMNKLLSQKSKDEMGFYEVRNMAAINIPNQSERQLVRLKMASNATTRAQIHVEVNLETDAINEPMICIASYLVNGDVDDLHPTETYIDGKHVMHLMYIVPMLSGSVVYFILRMFADGGAIHIDRQGVWLYASGLGLVGDSIWDGNFDLADDAEAFDIPYENFEVAGESVSITFFTPITLDGSDNAVALTIAEPTFDGNIRDRVRVVNYDEGFMRVLEGSDDIRVLEEEESGVIGDTRYTETEVR